MDSARRDNIVDFARYRAERSRAELPLVARTRPFPAARLTPFRRLSGPEVEHRARMLGHLRLTQKA